MFCRPFLVFPSLLTVRALVLLPQTLHFVFLYVFTKKLLHFFAMVWTGKKSEVAASQMFIQWVQLSTPLTTIRGIITFNFQRKDISLTYLITHLIIINFYSIHYLLSVSTYLIIFFLPLGMWPVLKLQYSWTYSFCQRSWWCSFGIEGSCQSASFVPPDSLYRASFHSSWPAVALWPLRSRWDREDRQELAPQTGDHSLSVVWRTCWTVCHWMNNGRAVAIVQHLTYTQ